MLTDKFGKPLAIGTPILIRAFVHEMFVKPGESQGRISAQVKEGGGPHMDCDFKIAANVVEAIGEPAEPAK